MLNFIDDLVGAIQDFLKPFIYFVVGAMLVGFPLIAIAKLFEWWFA
ncbi:hypothetical protein SAMN05880501_10481 [Ureibacillus xyleni]|uniref:Uncharacterized protein n=1 Tax=Ureibacillus xyleni TaxID=614648 RepID=A0A285SCU7_9BACL|nr:hypothetical protein [Ureibacillus xyleni]SOC05568.1 hypothetical protein SAMN05880501_10481 [Ureibacillus xyleni]